MKKTLFMLLLLQVAILNLSANEGHEPLGIWYSPSNIYSIRLVELNYKKTYVIFDEIEQSIIYKLYKINYNGKSCFSYGADAPWVSITINVFQEPDNVMKLDYEMITYINNPRANIDLANISWFEPEPYEVSTGKNEEVILTSQIIFNP